MFKHNMTQTLLRNTKGSVSLSFAISTTVLLLGAAVSMDVAQMTKKKNILQNVADNAALAAAISGKTELNDLKAVALDNAQANYPGEFTLNLTQQDSELKVDVVVDHNLLMLDIFNEEARKITTTASSQFGFDGKIQLALALDTTQSMNGSRMTALQSAAKDLIVEVEEAAGSAGNAQVSLVPFSNYVRVPKSYGAYSWLDVPPDRTSTWQSVDEENSTNCRKVIRNERRVTRCETYVYEEKTSSIRWNGCMGSRPDGRHNISEYGGYPFKGIAGSGSCSGNYSYMTPLSDDFEALKDNIDGFKANGQTYLPVGLQWAWRTLEEAALFTEETVDETETIQKVLLLMTDGSNTTFLSDGVSGWDGRYHWGSDDEDADRANADALTLEICESIKNDSIRIITVAFEVPDEQTKTLLQSCASTDADFYDAIDSTELMSAFGKIGSGLKQVRLTQ